MANKAHLDLLKQGEVEVWTQWRYEHRDIQPDLSGADLRELDLNKINLVYANLSGANISKANLVEANLISSCLSKADLFNVHLDGADLIRANLNGANLSEAYCYKANLVDALLIGANLNGTYLFNANLWNADLTEADLSGANLISARLADAKLTKARLVGTNLSRANLSGANLSEANLRWANLSEANLSKSNLTGCFVYAISAWNVQTQDTTPSGLIITHQDEPTIMVDNLKVAQFIYLLLNNQDIRDVIDTIARKAVLILGCFTPERKVVLDALRDELRTQGYLPILFDFHKPTSRDITETVSTLAHLARFVIADITDAKSIPQELMAIVPNLPSVAVQPLILNSQHEYGMFEHFTRFSWVLPVYRYTDEASLLQSLQEKVIMPAEQKAKELEKW